MEPTHPPPPTPPHTHNWNHTLPLSLEPRSVPKCHLPAAQASTSKIKLPARQNAASPSPNSAPHPAAQRPKMPPPRGTSKHQSLRGNQNGGHAECGEPEPHPVAPTVTRSAVSPAAQRRAASQNATSPPHKQTLAKSNYRPGGTQRARTPPSAPNPPRSVPRRAASQNAISPRHWQAPLRGNQNGGHAECSEQPEPHPESSKPEPHPAPPTRRAASPAAQCPKLPPPRLTSNHDHWQSN